jgi:DNA topoisomerase-6 subunit B
MTTKVRTSGGDSRQAGLFDAPPRRAATKSTRSAPATPASRRKNGKKKAPREDAQSMAARQREISVSEFFTKNRHLLGFDNPQKALLTAVREAVDNSLDACEEAEILPDLEIAIEEVSENRFRIAVQDNGPGIVREQVPKIFGKLLYGSKFHRLKQQRGQQGIGISAAGMYGQLTTGRPVQIISRTGKRKPAHLFRLAIDTQKNAPVIQKDVETDWDASRGTRVEIELEAVYKKGRRSVDDYVQQTALVNPHVAIRYRPPKDEEQRFERVTAELPEEAQEIQPHPYGVELGALIQLAKETRARNVRGMLASEFSRVSATVANKICEIAGVSADARPRRLSTAQVELLFQAIPKVKIMAPSTACLSPVGEELLGRGLQQRLEPDFYAAVTRSPAVYRGNPFQIEVGLAYGGSLAADEPVALYRFANRVPLQYQQSACAITKSVLSVDWKKYGLQQSRGALPLAPMAVLALMEAGRRVGIFVRRRKREADEEKKRAYITKYIPTIGEALQEIIGFSDRKRDKTIENLKTILERSRKM